MYVHQLIVSVGSRVESVLREAVYCGKRAVFFQQPLQLRLHLLGNITGSPYSLAHLTMLLLLFVLSLELNSCFKLRTLRA